MSNRLESLNNMLGEDPNDPFLKYAIALEKHKDGDIMEAIEILEDLRSNHEDYLGTYYQLGKFYEEIAEIDMAIATYKKGMKLAKIQNATKTYSELGEALFLLEDGD